MKNYKVAILGSTGAVGAEMIKVLEERNFPISELKCLASARSVGKKLRFKGKEIEVTLACDEAFTGMDLVLSAVDNQFSKQFSKAIVEAGAIMIDNSSAFRLDENVPLVIPEVNGEDVKLHHGIIANPNCSTIIALTAVNAIHQLSPIQKMVVSTYQAVSGAGINGFHELNNQVRELGHNQSPTIETFPYQIAYNVIPQIGDFDENGYTSEEMKMQNEGRKILHAPNLRVNCTCVRVPVMRSHSISITLETANKLDLAFVREAIAHAEGCQSKDDPQAKIYPMPLSTTDQDDVFVGRIRADLTSDTHGISLWCCGDQVRKGAATNAIQIAEMLIKQNVI